MNHGRLCCIRGRLREETEKSGRKLRRNCSLAGALRRRFPLAREATSQLHCI
jgi:hypothetical protein